MVAGKLMSYSKLIDKNIDRAFKLVKDLAIIATFTKRVDSTFNFNTGIAKNTFESIDVKVITKNIKKPAAESHNTYSQQIMFKTSDIPDVRLYDAVLIGSIAWKITKYIGNDTFITTVEISREV
jgi:hypothetical protein